MAAKTESSLKFETKQLKSSLSTTGAQKYAYKVRFCNKCEKTGFLTKSNKMTECIFKALAFLLKML